jgi:hypothetical protein
MNYKNLYVNLLLKHGTKEKPVGYSERHHIIPRSLGGTDSSENIIYLSSRAHLIAHWLLFKIHKNEKMARAFYGMCDTYRLPKRTRISSHTYEAAKKAFSLNNHMKLKHHRKRASESAVLQWAKRYDEMKASTAFMFKDETHPMYMKGKTGDKHPRSRAVITPLGRFGSVRIAAKAHMISHSVISRYCKSAKHPEYYYE